MSWFSLSFSFVYFLFLGCNCSWVNCATNVLSLFLTILTLLTVDMLQIQVSYKLKVSRFMISAHSFPQYVVDVPAIPVCVTHHCVWPLCNSPFFQADGWFWTETLLFVEIRLLQGENANYSMVQCFTIAVNNLFFSFPIVEHVPGITVVIHTLVLIQITTLLRSITSAGRFLLHFNCLHSTSGKMFTTM